MQYFFNDPHTNLITLLVENEMKAGRAVLLKEQDARIYLKKKIPELVSTKN